MSKVLYLFGVLFLVDSLIGELIKDEQKPNVTMVKNMRKRCVTCSTPNVQAQATGITNMNSGAISGGVNTNIGKRQAGCGAAASNLGSMTNLNTGGISGGLNTNIGKRSINKRCASRNGACTSQNQPQQVQPSGGITNMNSGAISGGVNTNIGKRQAGCGAAASNLGSMTNLNTGGISGGLNTNIGKRSIKKRCSSSNGACISQNQPQQVQPSGGITNMNSGAISGGFNTNIGK